MSYLLVISISLIFLFLWSRLPDPTGPATRNTPRPRSGKQRHAERQDTRDTKAGETQGPRLHPDQLGQAG